jgi:very-short-patch-repair endonuclease
MIMTKSHKTPTPMSSLLFEGLKNAGLPVACECSDSHKHVDLCILPAKLYIEVDGIYHYTKPAQIESDIKRDRFSEQDGYDTIRIPNSAIADHLHKIVKAIKKIAEERINGN